MYGQSRHTHRGRTLDGNGFVHTRSSQIHLSQRCCQGLRSNRGTNFIGAENELKKAVEEMDDEKIKADLLKDGIDWTKNPAKARNFGGVWERQIRSVRSVMNALIKQHGHRLDDESLRTFICESEAIVNSRPLTVETLNDPLSPLPLTPNALLTGKTKLVLPPPGTFQNEDVYCR